MPTDPLDASYVPRPRGRPVGTGRLSAPHGLWRRRIVEILERHNDTGVSYQLLAVDYGLALRTLFVHKRDHERLLAQGIPTGSIRDCAHCVVD